MSILSIIGLGVALSMDALAVAIAEGGSMRPFAFRQAFRIALAFGGFQALMPLVGWTAGFTVRSLVENWDHWISFGLLTVIGGRMIYGSFKLEEMEKKAASCVAFSTLLMLALATSLDALAVGLSLSFIKVLILWPAFIIGVVTFTISLAGVVIGYKFKHFFEIKMELVGGIILIGIGIKILAEHLMK
jgi:putative Mn2+ efflux pump MntP